MFGLWWLDLDRTPQCSVRSKSDRVYLVMVSGSRPRTEGPIRRVGFNRAVCLPVHFTHRVQGMAVRPYCRGVQGNLALFRAGTASIEPVKPLQRGSTHLCLALLHTLRRCWFVLTEKRLAVQWGPEKVKINKPVLVTLKSDYQEVTKC
jgi:hypothetical protein